MTELKDVNMANLPESAQCLVRLIGIEAATKLIEQRGGTTYPRGKKRTQAIAEIVGQKAADILDLEFDDLQIYIPSCKGAIRKTEQAKRDKAIHARFNALLREGRGFGVAVHEIALEYGLSGMTIRKILKVKP